MAFQNYGNDMVMPVQPMAGGYGGGFGGGMFGGDGAWWLLLLVLLGGGMWGGFGMGGAMGAGMMGFDALYPWMNQANQISGGFRDQMINDNVTAIREGISGINNQLCGGFAGVTAAVNGAQNAIAQQLATNQMAGMQQTFGLQTGIADLKYTVATENCADRTAAAQNARDIIDSQTRGTQAILDKLCALELDGFKRENDNLRQQLNMASLRESQTAQNAFIQQGFANEVDQLYNRLNTCPVPSTPVYGRTPIFTCGGQGCGCGAA